MKLNKKYYIILILFITVGTIIFTVTRSAQPNVSLQEQDLKPLGSNKEVELSDDPVGAKVDLEKLEQGCFGGKDCIPSIDSPVFQSISEGDLWLEDDDRVFGVNYQGIQRAYPQRIMNWHEIVNDNYKGESIVVTFCPLCGTAISFVAEVKGVPSEFGVSGLLFNNDLIMYDRLEGSLWQQASGEAIVGDAARRDERLKPISTTTTTWAQWKEKYPETVVLSRSTGHPRNYDSYPYGTYEEDDRLLFGVENSDDSYPLKTVTYGIIVDGQPKVYIEENLINNPSFVDYVNGRSIQVTRDEFGEVSFVDLETNGEYVALRGFWFAWVAFHPDTEVF